MNKFEEAYNNAEWETNRDDLGLLQFRKVFFVPEAKMTVLLVVGRAIDTLDNIYTKRWASNVRVAKAFGRLETDIITTAPFFNVSIQQCKEHDKRVAERFVLARIEEIENEQPN